MGPKLKVKCPECQKSEYHPQDHTARKTCCGKERCTKCLVQHFEKEHRPVKGEK